MAKFCGKCGHKLDDNTGLCPNCNKEEIESKKPPVQEPSGNNQNYPQPEEKLTRKQKRDKKKADKKAEKERIKASRTFGQKVKRFFIKLLIIILVIAILFGAGFGTLVYYGVVNIPAINNAIETLGLDEESKTNKDFKQIDGDFTDVKVVDGESAIEAVKSAKEQLGLDNATDELEVKNQNKVDSTTYYRLQQNYQGIPVYGRTIVVMANDDGDVQGLSSNAKDISNISLDYSFDEEKIENSITKYLKKYYNYKDIDNVVITPPQEEEIQVYELDNRKKAVVAYESSIQFEVDSDVWSLTFIIDLTHNKVIDLKETFNSAEAICYNPDKSIEFKGLKLADNKYFMKDVERNIYIYNAKKQNMFNEDNSIKVNAVSEVVSPDNIFGNGDEQKDPLNYNVATTYLRDLSKVYDYYKKFDEKGTGLLIGIYNDNFCDGDNAMGGIDEVKDVLSSGLPEYNDSTNNKAGVISMGINTVGGIDTIAHEYTHYISRYHIDWANTSTKEYNYIGAINEGFSDIFGEIIEGYVYKKAPDWKHGDRIIYDPSINNYPENIDDGREIYELKSGGYGYYVRNSNGEEVVTDYSHGHSTAISYAAYLMNTGGTENSNLSTDELAKLWYRTMLTLPSNCTYKILRYNMEMTAKVLNFSDEKQDLISTAFDTVGIFADEDKVPEYNKKLSVSAFGYNGKLYDNYKVTVKGTKNVALWGLFNEDYSKEVTVKKASPAELELPKGTYTISVSHGASSYSKKIKARSFAGNDELNFVTNFGYDDKENKTTSKSDKEVNTPVRTTSDERDIVLVLDSSGSMSGEPMKETKNAATKFVDTILDEDASIGIVTYDDEAKMSSDFSTNETHLVDTIDKISADGGTNIEAGLKKAENMLSSSKAKKKIVVLMSDGMPNAGLEGDELIAYADELKEEGIYIYTLGFFDEMYDKSSAQYLMEGIASEGCHYEVSDADSLVFFFGDIADQINGQKYIYVRIACPVDVKVSYDGETLNSSEKRLNTRTNFGTLTFEETEEQEDNNDNDKKSDDSTVKILRLKEGVPYDINIEGTGRGSMNYSIGFMDENGEYSDFRRFRNISINKKTSIDTVAEVSDSTVLNVDEDGDGKYDIKYKAKANSYGEEVNYTFVVYIVLSAVIVITLLIVILVICKKVKKKKQNKN